MATAIEIPEQQYSRQLGLTDQQATTLRGQGMQQSRSGTFADFEQSRSQNLQGQQQQQQSQNLGRQQEFAQGEAAGAGQQFGRGKHQLESGQGQGSQLLGQTSSQYRTLPAFQPLQPATERRRYAPQRSFFRRPAVINEVIIPSELVEVQPIIDREVETTEIVAAFEREVQRVETEPVLETRELPPQSRRIQQEGQTPHLSIPAPTREVRPATRQVRVEPPIIRETEIPHIQEVRQPIIEREVLQPRIIRVQKPIYEHVVELPHLKQQQFQQQYMQPQMMQQSQMSQQNLTQRQQQQAPARAAAYIEELPDEFESQYQQEQQDDQDVPYLQESTLAQTDSQYPPIFQDRPQHQPQQQSMQSQYQQVMPIDQPVSGYYSELPQVYQSRLWTKGPNLQSQGMQQQATGYSAPAKKAKGKGRSRWLWK